MKKEAEKKQSNIKDNDNSYGISSSTLGIVSLMLLFFFPGGSLILSTTSLIFSIKQRKISPNGWSKAGLIISIIGLVLAILTIISNILLSQNPEILANVVSQSANAP